MFGLTACTDKAAETPVTPDSVDVDSVITEAVLPEKTAFESLMNRLEMGETTQVILDACPFDDEGWIDGADPMGNLKCGETYTVSYDSTDGVWVVTGLEEYRTQLEGKDFVGTRRIAGAPSETGEMFLWGGRFVANEDGTISTRPTKGSDLTVVGHYK